MNPADCQPQLQQPYRRENWQKLLPQLLPGVEMFVQAHNFPLTSESERGIATARRQFGRAKLADGKTVAFYEIEVAPGVQLQSNRVGLRSLIVKCIDEVSAHAVLAFFVQEGKPFYRLTYAAKESKLGDDLKIQTEQTAPRRFTYILGAGESCRTAAERFVHYLCREGLRVWLEQFPPSSVAASRQSAADSPAKKDGRVLPNAATENNWPARLEKLFALDATDGLDDAERVILNDLLTPDEARALLDRLDNFRACDLAVGSGAFLVGLLHELVNLRRLCETRARGKDPATDIEWLYETKKRVIENVLYGVDIQQRAVEICKLRLWISLMVDYPLEVDPDKCALPDFRRAIKKITPLPNLDFKIRRANSLIEQIRGHAVKFPQTAADSRDFALSLSKLATAKHRFYEARKKKEKRLAQLDILEATAELAQYEFSAKKRID